MYSAQFTILYKTCQLSSTSVHMASDRASSRGDFNLFVLGNEIRWIKHRNDI